MFELVDFGVVGDLHKVLPGRHRGDQPSARADRRTDGHGLRIPAAARGRLVRRDLPGRGRRGPHRGAGLRRPPSSPEAAEIQAALLRLVRGLLPVPQVLEVRRADPPRACRRCWSPSSCPAYAATCCCRPSTTTGCAGWGSRSVGWPTLGGMPHAGARRLRRRRPHRRAVRAGPAGLARCARGGRRRRSSTRRAAHLPGAQRPQPQEPAPRPRHAGDHRRPRLGVRARRPPVHRPRQRAPLRPGAGVRRGRARRRTPSSAAPRPSRRWTSRGAADLYALAELASARRQNPVADRAPSASTRSWPTGDLHATGALEVLVGPAAEHGRVLGRGRDAASVGALVVHLHQDPVLRIADPSGSG